MSTRIQLRRDTAANWTSTNPILGQGEVGFEIDTYKLKIGDGTTVWNSLAYFASGSSVSFGTCTEIPFMNVTKIGRAHV